jgi:hypothetical protein
MKKARLKNKQTNSGGSTVSSIFDAATHSNMLTIEELKSFPDCENLDDKEAEEIIQSLYKLGLLTYEILNKEDTKLI